MPRKCRKYKDTGNCKTHQIQEISDDKPAVSGVRPSIFGAIQLIDSVWILNGFRYDSGAPRTHTLFGGGYIENLHVNGKIFNAESVSN